MRSLIYRHTTYSNNREVTTIRILGMPVFKRVVIDKEEKPRRVCGFTAYASDAPTDNDGDVEEDDDEQFIILPYGKKTD